MKTPVETANAITVLLEGGETEPPTEEEIELMMGEIHKLPPLIHKVEVGESPWKNLHPNLNPVP